MNQNLPKPMLDALTHEAAPTDHPSADLLAAFAENGLTGGEHRRIAEHLARCGDCREVVFLAAGTAEAVMQPQTDLEAARGVGRRLMPKLVWGMSIGVCLVVVASAVFLFRRESAPARQEMAATAITSPAAQPAQQVQELQPTPESKSITVLHTTAESAAPAAPVIKPQAKTARAKTVTPQGAETLGVGATAGIIASANQAPAKPTIPPTTEQVTVTTGSAAVATASPAPQVNSFAAVSGGAIGGPVTAGSLELNKASAARALRSTHSQWRITSDGHFEHLTADGWSRVLANQPAAFRVVSVVGNNVWVGGNSGALFHSRDDGQNWEAVRLNTPGGPSTATVVSIQFDDPQHGVVTTDSGTRCVTNDGGSTWNCR